VFFGRGPKTPAFHLGSKSAYQLKRHRVIRREIGYPLKPSPLATMRRAQSWSTGKVGINGISYYAMNQWTVGRVYSVEIIDELAHGQYSGKA
jgi:X-Pro dipeptidyl-peptidase (S15 family)